jgi:cytochrome c oxidase subunit 4
MTATVDDHRTDSGHEGEEHSAAHTAAEAWAHDKRYWIVALVLGILTAIEVTTYTHEDFYGDAAVPVLLVLMAVKFFIVTWEFMHLRIDRSKYGSNLLTIVFYFGLILAVAVYLVALLTFRFFEDWTP